MFTVLLVDDEFTERDGLRYLISKGGYDVNVLDAPNGEAAIKIIRNEPVDILISDIRMPFMDGLELSRRAREANPDMRILIYTAYGEFEYAQRAIEFHVSGYLLKPIRQDLFYHELEKVLNESSTIRSAALRRQSSSRRSGAGWLERKRLRFEWMNGWPRGVDGADPEKMHLHLMQVSFENAFFITHMQTFEQSFGRRTEGLWVLDPSHALLLFSSPETLGDARLLESGRRLQAEVRDQFRMTPSILIARLPRNADTGEVSIGSSMFDAFTLLDEHCSTRMFEPGCVQLLNDRLTPKDDDFYDHLEQIRLGVHGLLTNKDVIGVRVRLEELAHFLDAARDMPALYLKNTITEITYDIISHMGMESTERRKALEEIWTANDKRSLIGLLERYGRMLEGASFCDQNDSTAVDRILDIIHKEYNDDLTLEGIAARVFMAPSYVSFLFKRHTGQTLVKYLTCYRMECAARLLAGTHKQVTEITSLVGYDNPSYFSSIFRTYFGQTPSSYRKSHRGQDS